MPLQDLRGCRSLPELVVTYHSFMMQECQVEREKKPCNPAKKPKKEH